MKNKKGLIITIIVTVILVAITVAGLYFFTDIFKTNKEKFYKNIATVKIGDENFYNTFKSANKRIFENSNSSKMNISITALESNNSDEQNIATITSNGLRNTVSNQVYRNFSLKGNGQEFFNLQYIQDNNTYGIIVKNILAKYISIENNNLKEFFTKLGVEDVSEIPNTINENYLENIKQDGEIAKDILNRYIQILNNIGEEKFSYTSNAQKEKVYKVSLTEEDTANILIQFLDILKSDDQFLNKLLSYQGISGNKVSIEEIKNDIQEEIEKLRNDTYNSTEEFISLSLTSNGKIVDKLELKFKDSKEIENAKQYTISVDITKSNLIKLSVDENNEEILKSEISYGYDTNNLVVKIIMQNNENQMVNIQYQLNNYQTENINNNINVLLQDEEINYKIDLQNQIDFKEDIQIEKLTTENSVKLNDMTAEQLYQLIQAIVQRAQVVYGN